MVRSQRAANLTARRMRTGSSRKRMSGSPMVRTTRASRSAMPADVVDDLLALEVVEQPVDREVAPARVLLGRAEDVVAADQQVAALGLGAVAAAFLVLHLARVGAERGRLDDLRAEEDVREAEAAADDAAVPEQAPDVVGRRAGGDVEVLGLAAEQQVADAAADQVGGVIVAAQALDDFGGVGVYRVRFYLHSRLGVPHQRREITGYRRFRRAPSYMRGLQRRVRILEDGRLAAVSAGLARRPGIVGGLAGGAALGRRSPGRFRARRASAGAASVAGAVSARRPPVSAQRRASAQRRRRRRRAGGRRGRRRGGRRCGRRSASPAGAGVGEGPSAGAAAAAAPGGAGSGSIAGAEGGAAGWAAGAAVGSGPKIVPRMFVQANHATPTTATPPITAIAFAKRLGPRQRHLCRACRDRSKGV